MKLARLLYIMTLLLSLAAWSQPALATTVNFSDSAQQAYWPGFADPKNPHNQNSTDVIGDPQITGGGFVYTNHSLNKITLNYTSTSNVLVPADWFFDFNNDKKWDYVLHNSNTSYLKPDSYHLYDIRNLNMAIDGSTLFTVNGTSLEKIVANPSDGTNTIGQSTVHGGYDYSQWPGGYYGRYSHPVRIDDKLLNGNNVIRSGTASGLMAIDLGQVGFNGWLDTIGISGVATAIWDLGLAGIDLNAYKGQTFTYAFAMLCANDVVYGSSTVPTPEPVGLTLIGLGALAAAVWKRRRSKEPA